MQLRRLGRTGHHSSIAILGGAAFGQVSPEAAEWAFHHALARGVNHLDIAPTYGDAELLIGPHVPAVRDRLFVAGKSRRRNADGVRAQLDETLRRLGTDRLDLYQLHAVTDLDDLDSRADAVEVLLRAKAEGIVSWIGITGHDLGAPRAQLDALRRWDLDTVMFPAHPRVWADPTYRADVLALLAECARRDVGVMAIKAVARRPWGEQEKWADTRYEPWADEGRVTRGVRFALSVPGVHAFCTPGDLAVLELALDAADAFQPLAGHELDEAAVESAEDELIFPLIDKAR